MVEKKKYELKDFHETGITLTVELELDTGDVDAQDDKYVLFCSDDESVYKKTLCVRDDNKEGDEFLTLAFKSLVKGHRYTLEVNPGAAGDAYRVFEDVPLEELADQITYEGEEEEEEEGEEASDDIEFSDEEPDVAYEWLAEDEPLPKSYKQDDDLDEDVAEDDEPLV